MSWFDRDTNDATSSRFHNVATDDGVVSPVSTLHQHVGLQFRDHVVWRLFVEDGHGIDAFERCKNFGPLELRRERATRALDGANGTVRVDSDDEGVSQVASLPQVANMPWVKEIEDTICKDDTLPRSASGSRELPSILSVQNWHVTSLPAEMQCGSVTRQRPTADGPSPFVLSRAGSLEPKARVRACRPRS